MSGWALGHSGACGTLAFAPAGDGVSTTSLPVALLSQHDLPIDDEAADDPAVRRQDGRLEMARQDRPGARFPAGAELGLADLARNPFGGHPRILQRQGLFAQDPTPDE